MGKRLKNILRGAGSVFDVWPTADSVPFSIPKNPVERMRRPWERTGQAIQRAMDRVKREQATP